MNNWKYFNEAEFVFEGSDFHSKVVYKGVSLGSVKMLGRIHDYFESYAIENNIEDNEQNFAEYCNNNQDLIREIFEIEINQRGLMSMRNPQRIDELMRLLTEIWKMYPDLRFNQLIDSLQYQYQGGAYLKKVYQKQANWDSYDLVEVSYPDLFYVEDGDFIKFLKEYLDNQKQGSVE